jgi:hypothetical protein
MKGIGRWCKATMRPSPGGDREGHADGLDAGHQRVAWGDNSRLARGADDR